MMWLQFTSAALCHSAFARFYGSVYMLPELGEDGCAAEIAPKISRGSEDAAG